MSQSSPTPDPVAWMVRSGAGHSIGQPELVEALARGNAERYSRLAGWRDKPYTVVPLYDQPSALPATTPSDTPISEAQGYAMHRAFLNVTRPWHARGHTTWALEPEYVSRMFEHVIAAYRNAGGISPSEGSAPDTPLIAWPDGQLRPEEPYRCGTFVTGTGEQCVLLSDHDGPHKFPRENR